MSGNINLLLQKLQADSLAYKLVQLLKKAPKESWAQILDEKLQEELKAKRQEVIGAQNQES